MEIKIKQAGTFCPNTRCKAYGKVGAGNLVRYGHEPNGTRRKKCKVCGKVRAETRGTLFYRRRTPRQEIVETLALVADGVRISALSRAKGHKEDTILDWVREAGEHVEELEVILLKDYRVKRAQVDALWTFVRNKGKKGAMRKVKARASSGAAP